MVSSGKYRVRNTRITRLTIVASYRKRLISPVRCSMTFDKLIIAAPNMSTLFLQYASYSFCMSNV